MKIAFAVALVAAAAAAPAFAASPFDGTWKADLKSAKPSAKPHMFGVKDGTYMSDSVPPLSVKADGQFHKVTGHPYYDEIAVKVLSPRSIESTTRKAGKVQGTGTRTLSADGQRLAETYTDTSAPNGVPVKASGTYKRVGPAPAGALPVSGSWLDEGTTSASDAALTETIMVKGKTVSITTPTGISYDAPLDGKPVPIKGDPAGAMASIRMAGPRTLVETDTIAGKVESVTTTTVGADGRTADMAFDDKRSGRVNRIVARKQ